MNPRPGTTGKNEVSPHGALRPALTQYEFHKLEYCLLMNAVSCAVVPDPSERTTGTMRRAGSVRPGLSALIAGSPQFVITPVKILVSVWPERRRLVTWCVPILRLYMIDVPPATIGMYANDRVGGLSTTPLSERPYGISETPKSTVPLRNWLRPSLEPVPA